MLATMAELKDVVNKVNVLETIAGQIPSLVSGEKVVDHRQALTIGKSEPTSSCLPKVTPMSPFMSNPSEGQVT